MELDDHAEELLAAFGVLVFFGELDGGAEGLAARDDGDLVERIAPGQQLGQQRLQRIDGGVALAVAGRLDEPERVEPDAGGCASYCPSERTRPRISSPEAWPTSPRSASRARWARG